MNWTCATPMFDEFEITEDSPAFKLGNGILIEALEAWLNGN